MLNLQKIILPILFLVFCSLPGTAQKLMLYRGAQAITPSQSLLAQEVFEEDELYLMVTLDTNFQKAHPDIQRIRPFKTLITHQRKDGKMQTMILTGQDRFTLAPFRPIEGEVFLIEVVEWMLTRTDGTLQKQPVQDKVLKLVY